MNYCLHSLLPEEISDEAAYQLTEFLYELAIAVESHYIEQLRPYTAARHPSSYPACHQENKSDDDDLF